MATLVAIRHPVPIVVTYFTTPNNFSNDLNLDLWALTLVGPSEKNPVLDPLAVLHLDNQLLINVGGCF